MLLITPHILMTPIEGQVISDERIRKLSRHPYIDEGDAALDQYFEERKRPRHQQEDNRPEELSKFSPQNPPNKNQDGDNDLFLTDTFERPKKEPNASEKIWVWTGERTGDKNHAKAQRVN